MGCGPREFLRARRASRLGTGPGRNPTAGTSDDPNYKADEDCPLGALGEGRIAALARGSRVGMHKPAAFKYADIQPAVVAENALWGHRGADASQPVVHMGAEILPGAPPAAPWRAPYATSGDAAADGGGGWGQAATGGAGGAGWDSSGPSAAIADAPPEVFIANGGKGAATFVDRNAVGDTPPERPLAPFAMGSIVKQPARALPAYMTDPHAVGRACTAVGNQ